MVAVAFFASGCVFYPRTIEYYDAQCEIRYRKLVLESEAMKESCSVPSSSDPEGRSCLAFVVAMSAGSAIVSRSIVVVGNTVYWLERKGKCLAKQRS